MTLEGAVVLAKKLHAGQYEKFSPRTPFFYHLERVAERVEGETAKVVAYLHDSIEDGKITLEELGHLGVTPRQLEALALVSRKPREQYFSYIKRIVESQDVVALQVKKADLRVHFDYGKAPETLQERYTKALKMLVGVV